MKICAIRILVKKFMQIRSLADRQINKQPKTVPPLAEVIIIWQSFEIDYNYNVIET